MADDITAPIATDRDEPPYTVVSAFRDVTESLARERSLAEAEERFRSIFSMAPIGMGIVRNGYVIQANQAWADIVGRSTAQLEGRRVDDFTFPGDPATVAAAGFLDDGGRSAYRVEKRYLHAEGHAVWVQVDLSAVRQADGAIRYVTMTSGRASARSPTSSISRSTSSRSTGSSSPERCTAGPMP